MFTAAVSTPKFHSHYPHEQGLFSWKRKRERRGSGEVENIGQELEEDAAVIVILLDDSLNSCLFHACSEYFSLSAGLIVA